MLSGTDVLGRPLRARQNSPIDRRSQWVSASGSSLEPALDPRRR